MILLGWPPKGAGFISESPCGIGAMATRIHPTAEVSPAATIGDGTTIWHWAQVRENARVGRNCRVGKDVYIDTKDRKSTRLNSSHLVISYAVFCLKKTTYDSTMQP